MSAYKPSEGCFAFMPPVDTEAEAPLFSIVKKGKKSVEGAVYSWLFLLLGF